MRIISLEVSNVKRIRAVTIKADGSLVVIGGDNGAGKSSALDSIAYTIGGKRACPKVPIRRGEDSARTKIVLDNGLVITRDWTADGRTELTVESEDGARYKTPQAIMDGLTGPLCIDPVAFSRAAPAEQLEIVRQLVGLDLSEFDVEHAKVYTERHDVNRDAKRAEAELAQLPEDPDAPGQEVSVAGLVAELDLVRGHNATNSTQRRALADNMKARDQKMAEVDRVSAQLKVLVEDVERTDLAIAQSTRKVEALLDQDEAPLREQIAGAEGINRRVRAARQHTAVAATAKGLRKKSQGMTDRLAEIESEKHGAIASAEYPIEGLTVGDGCVLLDGLPLDQASSAERLKVSVAIGFALNPKLKVLLVRDGSLLDESNLAALADMAEAADGQVWLERVGKGGASVVIEDGSVREDGGAS